MLKYFVATVIVFGSVHSMAAGKVANASDFGQRAQGRYQLVSGESTCLRVNVTVEYATKAELKSLIGTGCGDALLIGSEDQPMGPIFCRVNNTDIQPAQIDFGVIRSSEDEDLSEDTRNLAVKMAEAGRENATTVKSVLKKENNSSQVFEGDIVQVTERFTLTPDGFDLEGTVVKSDGTRKRDHCVYKKIGKLK